MDDVVVGIEEESTHDDDEALTSIQNTITTKHHPPSDGSNNKRLTNAHTRRQEVDEGTNQKILYEISCDTR